MSFFYSVKKFQLWISLEINLFCKKLSQLLKEKFDFCTYFWTVSDPIYFANRIIGYWKTSRTLVFLEIRTGASLEF